MSLPSTHHFHMRDVMEENNLMPWWEKIRRFAYSGRVVLALFIMWVTIQPESMHCLPKRPENNTIVINFTPNDAKMVNMYCFRQLRVGVRYAGIIAFGIVLLLFTSANVLMTSPEFMGAFKTSKKVEKLFDEWKNNINEKELRKGAAEDYAKDEFSKSKRSSCFGLNSPSGLYCIRNLLLILASGGALCYLVYFIFGMFQDQGYLICQLSEAYQNELEYSLRSHKSFFCSYNLVERLIALEVAFASCVFIQCLFGVIGGMLMTSCPVLQPSSCCSDGDSTKTQTGSFMNKLWVHSEPTMSGEFSEFVKNAMQGVDNDN